MWKKYQSAQKSRKKARSAFLALGLLFFVLSFARIIHIVTALDTPLTPGLVPEKKYVWDGHSVINVLFTSIKEEKPNFSVVSFNPKEERVTIIDVPEQTYIDLPKKYGSWKLGSIYRLGQEEKNPAGAYLLELSVSKLLGLHMDGIVVLNSNQKASEFVESLKKNPLSRLVFLGSGYQSELTPAELTKFFWSISSARSDKIAFVDLSRSNITDSKLLPDSSRVLGVNAVKLDLFVQDKMSDPLIIEEGSSVAIFNAAGFPGLAQQASRMVTNLGGNVVLVANAGGIVEESVVFSDQEKEGLTFTKSRLTQIFAPRCQKEKCQSVDPKVASSRAQINIVLGRDYYKTWYERE